MHFIYQIQNVLESRRHIKNYDSQDIKKRVEDLLERGFIYNPYFEKFFNPFFDGIKSVSFIGLVNLDWNKFISTLDSTLRNLKSSINTEEKLTNLYNREYNNFLFMAKIQSWRLGIILFATSIALYFFVSKYIVTSIILLSFLFIRYYVMWNSLDSIYRGEFDVSRLWRNNKNKFKILKFIVQGFLIMCLNELLDNLIFAILTSVVISLLSDWIFLRIESKDYFHESIFAALADKEYMNNFNSKMDMI